MPSHSHSNSGQVGYDGGNGSLGPSRNSGPSVTSYTTGATGGGGSHSHSTSGSITSGGSGTSGSDGAHTHTIAAPQYIDVIICSKDA